MTEQEELREAMWQILHAHKKQDEWSSVVLDIIDLIKKYCCLKAERELPYPPQRFRDKASDFMAYQVALQDMLKEVDGVSFKAVRGWG